MQGKLMTKITSIIDTTTNKSVYMLSFPLSIDVNSEVS